MMMTSQRHFSFPFSEEMDDLIDFLFVRSLFFGIRPSKNIKKSDIELLVPFRVFSTVGSPILCSQHQPVSEQLMSIYGL